RVRAENAIHQAGKSHYRNPFRRADFELRRFSRFHPQPRNRRLATDVTNANVRLGDGRGDRGDVDGKSALVRGRVLLGNWRHASSRPHAEPALRFSRLAVYKFLYLAFSHYHRRDSLAVDSPVSA